MKTSPSPPAVAVLFAAFALATNFGLAQKNSSVPFPSDQIALQLGALQMGYTTAGTPFNPASNAQQAANALAQGRIALARTNGWGTNNVAGATQPASLAAYASQLDSAVMAVMASAGTNTIKGKVNLANGKVQNITAKLTLPSPNWTVPLPYAIDALTVSSIGGAGGGTNNTAGGTYSWVGGGIGNSATTNYATVTAGATNTASGISAAVGGGENNTASGGSATVAGGQDNVADFPFATISGGKGNRATTFAGAIGLVGSPTVGGGYYNTASGDTATVAGGYTNTARGDMATVAGGGLNSATNYASTVAGGYANTNGAWGGSIAGGLRNFVTNNSDGSSIGGGTANRVLATNVDTGGGQMMQAAAVIAGGQSNTVMAVGGFIGGGAINSAWSNGATVAGGALNAAVGLGSAVVGGFRNEALGVGTFVGGGEKNSADLDNATVGGGEDNTAQGTNATVAGGYNNVAAGPGATVAGGQSNFATNYAAVGGGSTNSASDRSTTVGGGFSNSATSAYGVVAGGFMCSNAAFAGSLGGGYENKLGTGSYITVAGGLYNEAGPGWYSTIPGGVKCKAIHDGSFVWSGVDTVTTSSTNTRSFTVRAPGGVRFITSATATDFSSSSPILGVYLAPLTTSWAALSDSNAKTAVKAVDPRAVLEKVGRLPVTEWEYKHDPHRRYFGPMAQDFHAAFALGSDDKTINTLDADGVLFLSVKGLIEELKERDAKIEKLERELGAFREQMQNLFPPSP